MVHRGRITLLHNPEAGDGSDPASLLHALDAAGWDVTYQSSKSEAWRDALEAPGRRVVAAGGDGTVRKAAAALAGSNVPLAILPLGTANNVATALGIDASPDTLITSLAEGQPRRLDVGVAVGPWGRRIFVESLGAGLLAKAAREVHRAPDTSKRRGDDKIAYARRVLRERLAGDKASPAFRVETNESSDRELASLFVEVCNVRFSGPRLMLAPHADPGDGLLDVVLGGPLSREALVASLGAAEIGANPCLADGSVRRARIALTCRLDELRIDGKFGDELAPRVAASTQDIVVEPWPHALPVLVPRSS